MSKFTSKAMAVGVFLAIFSALLGGIHIVTAQSLSPAGLVAEVNALRASRGLAPYRVDPGLMTAAQDHADYMAIIGQSTHTHRNGMSPSELGFQENIAEGSSSFMTSSLVVYQIWADALHLNTMTGYAGGTIGVGVASNGDTVYVALNVLPEGSASASAVNAGATGSTGSTGSVAKPAAQATTFPQATLLTSTPRPDGTIIHVVASGQSLWGIAIAYSVRIDEIRALNGMPPGSTDIYPGQNLVISKGSPVTPTPDASPTAAASATRAATRTPRPTATLRPTRTAAKEISASPTATIITAAPTGQLSNLITTRNLLAGAVFLGAAILLVVFFWTFKK